MRRRRRLTTAGVVTLASLVLTLAAAAAAQPTASADEDGAGATAQAERPVAVQRQAGATRFETAARIATSRFDSATAVVVATGEGHADALAAAALAGHLDAPVLLAPGDVAGGSIPPAVTDAIDELGATRATLLGGPDAISPAVADRLVAASTVTDTDRVAGATRFETAAAIAGQIDAAATPSAVADQLDVDAGRLAFLATDAGFADALAAGPGAYAGPHPILLTGPDELHPAAERGLAAADVDSVILLGGKTAVSPAVEAELADRGYATARLAGSDRWDTSVEIADALADGFGFGAADVGLATGTDHADALASAPHLGAMPAPLVLTPGQASDATLEAWFAARGCDLATLHVFGGQRAVGQALARGYADAACRAGDDTPTADHAVALSWVNVVDDADPDAPAHLQGAPGATGEVELTVDAGRGRLDYDLSWDGVTGLAGAGGAHLHAGDRDATGPAQARLASGAELAAASGGDGAGSRSGTVAALAATSQYDSMGELAAAIAADPDGFYVDVHTDGHAHGAVRGQLPDGGGDAVLGALALQVGVDETEVTAGDDAPVRLAGDDYDQLAAAADQAALSVRGACVDDGPVELSFGDEAATGTAAIRADAAPGDCEVTFELAVNPVTTFTTTVTVVADESDEPDEPVEPVDPPALDEVTAVGPQHVELVWDEAVDLAGVAGDVTVEPDGGGAAVATGAAVSGDDGDASLEVALDAALADDTAHELVVADGAVHDADANANPPGRVMFTTGTDVAPTIADAAVNGTPVADGETVEVTDDTPRITGVAGDGYGHVAAVGYTGVASGSFDASDGAFDDGEEAFAATLAAQPDGEHTLEIVATDDGGADSDAYTITVVIDSAAPSVQRAATIPTRESFDGTSISGEGLRVVFDEPVDCSASSADQWDFTNDSAGNLGGHAEASGAPYDVVQADDAACALLYNSVEADDFGTLDYSGTGVVEAHGDATPAATFAGQDVVDTVAPRLDGSLADHRRDEVRVELSEPIDCATLGGDDLAVTVDGVDTGYTVASCDDADMSPTVELDMDVAESATVAVTVASDAIADESGDNRLAAGASSTAPAFVDAAATGTRLDDVSTCDDCGQTVTMPFSATLFGESSADLLVSSNGFVQFGPPGTTNEWEYTNEAFPTTNLEHALAPFWDDLQPGAGGAVFTDTIGSTGDRRFIVQWDRVAHFSRSEGRVTVQLVIHESGAPVELRYVDTTFGANHADADDGASATIGSNLGDGSTAQQHSFNTPSVSAGDVVTVTP